MRVRPRAWVALSAAGLTTLALLAGCTSTPNRQSATADPAAQGTSAPRGGLQGASVPAAQAKPTATPRRATGRTQSTPAKRSNSAPAPTSSAMSPASPSAAPVPHDTVIVLNPGHNGANATNPAAINRQVPAGFGEYKACDTTGTETNLSGYPEHAFTWDVSLRVRSLLQARGVRVVLTRSNDSGVGPCVDERARIGNQPGVAAVVSIHADGAPVAGHGFHVCEDSRQPAGAAVASASHRLTVAVHDALLRGSGLTVSSYLGSNGYYPRSDLAGLNLASVPSTFLEIGNMRNAGDAALQQSADGRQRIAQSVAAGVLAWLGR
jgi:N-acetylmuramoyl-L-alanine amidase